MPDNWDCPQAEVVEVSLFGRGCGECVVIHFGSGRWMVIDSFTVDGKSIAQRYLEQIGVDVATQVDLILATHWHDDHIRGVSDLMATARSARGALPLAMLREEFLAFARTYHTLPASKAKSGVQEMGRYLATIKERGWQYLEPAKSWAGLMTFREGELAHGLPVQVTALSPSNADVATFLGMVAGAVVDDEVAMSAPYYDENDVSVAVHIDLGEQAVLLGADLETRANPDTGWEAVFRDHRCPERKAKIYKVAHHGSETGHHASIWDRLCVEAPTSSLSPWARGKGRLPSQTDIQRILKLSGDSYSSSQRATAGKRQRLTAVTSILRNTQSTIRNIDQSLGQVRHRLIDGNWETQLFGEAVTLNRVST